MLRSVWEATHERPAIGPAAAGEPLAEVGGAWDVVVIGAGVTGLTTALLAAERGRTVLVLEARRAGSGTTGRSTAKVSLLQGTQLSAIARHHPPRLVQHYVDANRTAQEWVRGFCDRAGVRCEPRESYTYATTASGEAAARRELALAHDAGLDVAWVDDVPLPFATRGAVALPDQAQVDPIELVVALREAVEARGGRVAEDARALGVDGHDPVVVRTVRGHVEASTVVVATNAPILDRGAFFARVTPARSYSIAYRPADATAAPDGMFLSTDQPSRSLRDAVDGDGSRLLLVGGNGHVTGRTRSEAGRLDEIRSWALDVFGPMDEVTAWSAQDYVPHHALPYAGPVLPGRRDVLVAGGFSKWGMTNGVAAALALIEGLDDRAPSWAEAFATWSPRELTGFPAAARANAEVGLALTAGWARTVTRLRPPSTPGEGAGEVGADLARRPVAASTVAGVTRRVSGVCSHLGGVVAWNDAERSWDCPLHGSRFDADGEVLEGVATCGLRRLDP